MAIVIVALGLNLLGTKRMCELLNSRINYAEANQSQWKKEFVDTLGKVHLGLTPKASTTFLNVCGSLKRGRRLRAVYAS